MGSRYRKILPEVFAVYVTMSHEEAERCVCHLLQFDPEHTPNGSSFACTSDGPEGHTILWLSRVSYEILINAGMVPVQEVG